MNRTTMFELNEKYSDCPVEVREYEIDGKRYIVHSHFVGNKDIDKVISDIALNRALSETLNKTQIVKSKNNYSDLKTA